MITREQLEKENRALKIAGLIIVVGLLFVCSILSIQLNSNKNVCYDYVGLNETLVEIQKNCGSTFITEHYNKYEWYIFDSSDCKGEYCKQSYHKLEDCLD